MFQAWISPSRDWLYDGKRIVHTEEKKMECDVIMSQERANLYTKKAQFYFGDFGNSPLKNNLFRT